MKKKFLRPLHIVVKRMSQSRGHWFDEQSETSKNDITGRDGEPVIGVQEPM
jgi:hypothetical protein